MKSILDKHGRQLALVIGNGVNRYGDSGGANSWADLLIKLAKRYLPARLREVPDGVTLTEFYDVLELKKPKSASVAPLQQQFCDLMSKWMPFEHHRQIVAWAKDRDAPILTTNFERIMADAGNCTLRRTRKGGFTAYYPWESYYGFDSVDDPGRQFGIWHINGMERYRQSIRLGLSHYMGSVQRARSWLHRGDDSRLFSGKSANSWEGADSWLHVIFNTPLLIFGLRLDETEVFLRWLLIERARYFRKFPSRRKPAWYVHEGRMEDRGKAFFLSGVGINTVQVDDYDAIYGRNVWQ